LDGLAMIGNLGDEERVAERLHGASLEHGIG
jgi:hypothetical protein